MKKKKEDNEMFSPDQQKALVEAGMMDLETAPANTGDDSKMGSVTASQSEESQLAAKAISEADLLSSGKKDLVDLLLEKLKLTEESGVLSGQQSSNATTGDPVVPLQDGTVPAFKVTQENSQSETFQKPNNSTPSGKPVKKRKYKYKEGLAHYSSIKKVTKPVSSSDDSYSASSESDEEDKLPLQKEPRMGMVRRVVPNHCGFVPTRRSKKKQCPFEMSSLNLIWSPTFFL